MLRLSAAGEGCRRVKCASKGWLDLLDVDGFQVCCFALCLLAWNLFDLVIPLGINLQYVSHFCEEPNAVLTAVFDVDNERLLAGPGRALVRERVFSGAEMEGYETTHSDASQPLLAVKKPSTL